MKCPRSSLNRPSGAGRLSPMDAIVTIKGLLDIAKQLKGFAKDAEGKMLVANLTSDLAELKIAFAELQEENHELRTKLKERDDLSSLREHMERRDDVYFLTMDGRDPGPYCPKCLDVDGKLVPVSKFSAAFAPIGKYNCPNCKAAYG